MNCDKNNVGILFFELSSLSNKIHIHTREARQDKPKGNSPFRSWQIKEIFPYGTPPLLKQHTHLHLTGRGRHLKQTYPIVFLFIETTTAITGLSNYTLLKHLQPLPLNLSMSFFLFPQTFDENRKIGTMYEYLPNTQTQTEVMIVWVPALRPYQPLASYFSHLTFDNCTHTHFYLLSCTHTHIYIQTYYSASGSKCSCKQTLAEIRTEYDSGLMLS